MATGGSLIRVTGLKKYYNKGAIKALDNVSVDINRGDVMVIIGPSGSGKSTFLRSLNLLEEPTEGSIVFDGVDITKAKTKTEDGKTVRLNIDQHRQKMGMVYGIAKMLNFAHGDVIMVGGYLCFCTTAYLGWSPLPAVLLAIVGCTVLGIVVERLAYKPLRSAPSLAVLITAIGVSYFLQNAALLLWGSDPKVFPTFFNFSGKSGVALFGGQLNITYVAMITVAACLVIMLVLTMVYRLSGGATVFENIPDGFSALGTAKLGRVPLLSVLMVAFVLIFWFVMRHTPAGRKFYAIGGGEEAARIAGIRVKKYKILAFVLCAVMACATGMLIASRVGSANTTAGDGYFLKSYAAVFIGCTASRRGVPNVLGSLLGAAILGVLANGLTMVDKN